MPLGHESFWPIYEEAEKLDCMVGVHATVRGPHYFAGDMFDQFIEVHTLSHSFAQMMHCTQSDVSRRLRPLSRSCAWLSWKRGAVGRPTGSAA